MLTMLKMDRKKPFATVFGDLEGRRFEQDGVFFDGEDNEHVAVPAEPADDELAAKDAAKADVKPAKAPKAAPE